MNKTTLVAGYVSVLLWGGAFAAQPGDAASLRDLPKPMREPAAAECLLGKGVHASLLRSDRTAVDGILVQYDRNRDGRTDFQEAYELVSGGVPRPFPYKYWIDEHFNGTFNRVVSDIAGDGRCQDMREQSDDGRSVPEQVASQFDMAW